MSTLSLFSFGRCCRNSYIKTMKKSIYNNIVKLIFFLTSAFLLIPLIALFLRGFSSIPTLITNEEVIFSVFLSFKTTIIATLICIVLAIPSAIFLTSLSFKKQRIVKNLLFLPLSLPHLVSGIALLLFFGNLGIGRFLEEYLGISFVYTEKGVVLAQVFVNLPLTIKLILMSIESINDKMIFVARTLGCSAFESFRFVLLPSLKNGIISSAVLTWSKALGEFGAVLMLAGSTRLKTEILPTAIYLNMSTGDVDLAIGVSIILIILSLLSLIIFELAVSKEQKEEKAKNNYYV